MLSICTYVCRFLTAAACGMRDVDDDSQDQLFRAVGLLPSHAYSVLDVRLIPLDQRKALRQVRCFVNECFICRTH